jgi:hypothetical protein
MTHGAKPAAGLCSARSDRVGGRASGELSNLRNPPVKSCCEGLPKVESSVPATDTFLTYAAPSGGVSLLAAHPAHWRTRNVLTPVM